MKKIILTFIIVLINSIAAIANGHLVSISSQANVACTGSATGSATASVSGGVGPFTYSWIPGGQTTVSVIGLTAGTYTVTATDQNDLSTASALVIITQPALALTINATASPAIYCTGSYTSLNCGVSGGTPSYTYNWTPNIAISTIGVCNPTANPITTTTYTLTIVDQNGCSAISSVIITVNPNPNISVSNATTICEGSNTILTPSGGNTYSWTPMDSLNYGPGSSVTINPIVTTTYTLSGTSIAGCTNTATVVISVNPKPIVIVPSVSICNGTSTTLTASGASTYTWMPATGLSATTGASVIANPTVTTTFTVTGTGLNGCTASTTVCVGVLPNPIATISGVTTICNGASTILTASAYGVLYKYNYNWSPNNAISSTTANVVTVNPSVTTTYTVTYSDLGCTNSEAVVITVNAATLAGVIVADSIYKETCLGTKDGGIDITLSGTNTGPFTYQWNTGMTTEDITNLTTNNYTFTIFDASMNCLSKNYSVSAIGTSCGSISGNVFEDINLDCMNNGSDLNLPNVMITTVPGNYKAYTNKQGNYVFNNVPYGAYKLTQQLSNTYVYSSCADTLNTTLNSGNNNVNNLNFGDTIASGFKDVEVDVVSSFPIVPGFTGNAYFYLKNLTTVPTGGIFSFILPVGIGSQIIGGTPSNYTINGDTVNWVYSNTPNYYVIYFTVPVSTPLSSVFTVCANATVNGVDTNMVNNTYCYQRIVKGSFDPNDKSVSPVGEDPQGNITLSNKTLDYHINFQNTGNGPAVNIVVKDTLSDKLDISTLEVTGTSHDYILDVMPGNVLRWKFNNIMLADSGSNQVASHGWISYRIKQKASNQIGYQIKNTAYIYFDFNPAVITNTTLNTIAATVGVEKIVSTSAVIKVYPNPSSGSVQLEYTIKPSDTGIIKIYDLTGKLIEEYKLNFNTNKLTLNTNLNNGIYLYQVIVNDKIVKSDKLVIIM